MTDELNQAFNRLLENFVSTCRSFFDQNLIGIVLFGAHREYFVHTQHDVDLLVVCRELPESGWERYDLVMQLMEEMEHARTQMESSTGYSLYLSPVLKSLDEMHHLKLPLRESIRIGRILYDVDSQIENLIQSFASSSMDRKNDPSQDDTIDDGP